MAIYRRQERDYLQQMRLWSNFFATSGAEVSLMRSLGAIDGQKVLEIGCGDGRLSFRLCDHASRTTGVDLEERLIDFANDYALRTGIKNTVFMPMSAESLAFEDETFDAVIMPWMLHMLPDKDLALKEARRVLKPNGRLFVFALLGDCDYDKIARHFVASRDKEFNVADFYEESLTRVFHYFEKHPLPYASHDFSFVFPDCGVTAEAFIFAFANWYETNLNEKQRGHLRHLIQNFRWGNHIALKTRGILYVTEKLDDPKQNPILARARQETEKYHRDYYKKHKLFEQGSWLAKPDQDSMEVLEELLKNKLLENKLSAKTDDEFRVIDLGAGVGRNSIAMAMQIEKQMGPRAKARVVCVDVLAESIEILKGNATTYDVEHIIDARVANNDDLLVQPETYDLALAISCLEHCSSKDDIARVLDSLVASLKPGGVLRLEMTTDRNVRDVKTNELVPTYVETPLTEKQVKDLVSTCLSPLETMHFGTFAYKEEIEMNGRKVLWQSTQLNYTGRKSG